MRNLKFWTEFRRVQTLIKRGEKEYNPFDLEVFYLKCFGVLPRKNLAWQRQIGERWANQFVSVGDRYERS